LAGAAENNVRHYHVRTTAKLLPLALILLAPRAIGAPTGEDIFAENCASCHGTDGKGRTPAGKKLGAKDLTASKISEAEIARQILDGTKDPKGAARMPAFKERLSPNDIPALADYVKSFRK